MNESELKCIIHTSSFNKPSYNVDLPLQYFGNTLLRYIDREKSKLYEDNELLSINLVLANGIPNFQRNNDKWSKARKINFVENVICGYKSTIQLYTLSNNITECKILDGLQRVTAISDFINGKIKLFDGQLSYKEFVSFGWSINTTLNLQVFRFTEEYNVIKFYIDMNRGITHSSKDIKKAENILLELDTKPQDT